MGCKVDEGSFIYQNFVASLSLIKEGTRYAIYFLKCSCLLQKTLVDILKKVLQDEKDIVQGMVAGKRKFALRRILNR